MMQWLDEEPNTKAVLNLYITEKLKTVTGVDVI